MQPAQQHIPHGAASIIARRCDTHILFAQVLGGCCDGLGAVAAVGVTHFERGPDSGGNVQATILYDIASGIHMDDPWVACVRR